MSDPDCCPRCGTFWSAHDEQRCADEVFAENDRLRERIDGLERAACLAGADALRRGTCGTCQHCVTGYAIEGTGSCAGPNGSIGGWVPLHASCKFHAPTEPTR